MNPTRFASIPADHRLFPQPNPFPHHGAHDTSQEAHQ